MRRVFAAAAAAALLIAAAVLLAYRGTMEEGLLAWTNGDLSAARTFFERFADDSAEGELARLNTAIASGELALDELAALPRVRSAARADRDGSRIGGDRPAAAVLPAAPPADPADSAARARADGPLDFAGPAPDGGSDRDRAQTSALARLADASRSLTAENLSGSRQSIAWHHAGRFALAAGDSAQGLALLDRAYRREPQRQDFANPLLLELMRRGEPERLSATARHHAEQRPDNPFAWWALGEADRLRGLEGRALGQFKRGIEVFPLRPMLETGIAMAVAAGRDELARDWLATLRLRYGGPERTPRMEAWCDSLGCGALWRALPPDTEAARYADRFPQFFPVGREWTYNVRYGFIPLGKLVVAVLAREDRPLPGGGTEEAYRVMYRVDSNPLYRLLLDLHDEYEAVIPAHCLHSTEFVTRSRQNDERYDRIYEFDQAAMEMTARGYRVEGDVYRLRVPIARQLFDGLSLLFAARRQVLEGRFGPVLTIVDEEVHRTVIEADGRGKVKALGRSRPVVQLHGSADYQGIAGLTGEFWGSLSDDDEALPLAARFQIKVGRITIELDDQVDGPRRKRP